MGLLQRILAHPLTRGLDIDDPRTTALRRRIIQEKPFLRRIYEEWYGLLRDALPWGSQPALELGSGAGFAKEAIPNLITSEIFATPGVDLVLDGQQLPLPPGSLRGIVMSDVLHHLPQVRRFFAEAARCVRPGGAVAMIEPWVTPWSSLIYTRLHHEPFVPEAAEWHFPASGPLSAANGALPWIIFQRDRQSFERQFPQLRVERIQPLMPLRYLLSGGVSMRGLMPGVTFGLWRYLEAMLLSTGADLAMFALIVLRRN